MTSTPKIRRHDPLFEQLCEDLAAIENQELPMTTDTESDAIDTEAIAEKFSDDLRNTVLMLLDRTNDVIETKRQIYAALLRSTYQTYAEITKDYDFIRALTESTFNVIVETTTLKFGDHRRAFRNTYKNSPSDIQGLFAAMPDETLEALFAIHQESGRAQAMQDLRELLSATLSINEKSSELVKPTNWIMNYTLEEFE